MRNRNSFSQFAGLRLHKGRAVKRIKHLQKSLGIIAITALGLVGTIPVFENLSPTVAVAADEVEPAPITITVERTDNYGDEVHVGDELTFKISYTNNTDKPLTAYPGDTNLAGVMVQGNFGGCRWANLRPAETQSCNFGTYLVTEKDVKEGVKIYSNWKATTDREGKIVVPGGEALSATTPPAITKVDPQPRTSEPPDEAVKPQDRAMGESVQLARGSFNKFTCHRIPALTQAPNGDLLAAWDGRPGSCMDAPNANSIIMRRSTDGGKSWEMPITVASGFKGVNAAGAGKYGYSDPSFVVDRQTGEIFMFFVKSFDNGFAASKPGTDVNNRAVLHAAVTSSTDNGQTWSEPRVITKEVSTSASDFSRFAASGEGIQVRHGKHQGRLVQQYTVRVGTPQEFRQQAVSVYSDDHGKTWKAGQPVGDGMDENKVVELSDGTLMMNSRRSDAGSNRKVAYSQDGGETWSQPTADLSLIDPHNNASIIRAFPDAPAGDPRADILLFSNAYSANSRTNGTVHISWDNGQTWPVHKQFKSGNMSYSTLTPILSKPGTYGLLYEGDSSTIYYTTLDFSYLGANPDGSQAACSPSDRPVTKLKLAAPVVNEYATDPAIHMVDGDLNTIWHSDWSTGQPVSFPVELKFATAEEKPVAAEQIRLTPRQDGKNGRFKAVEIWVGSDASNLEKLADLKDIPNSGEPISLPVTGKQISHIKLVVHHTWGDTDDTFASLAEVQLLAKTRDTSCVKLQTVDGTVVYGVDKDGYVAPGAKVMVKPVPKEGETFKYWQTDPASLRPQIVSLAEAIALANPNSADLAGDKNDPQHKERQETYLFNMPAVNTTITARYVKENGTQTDNPDVNDSDTQTDPITPPETGETGTQTDPEPGKDSGTQTDPVIPTPDPQPQPNPQPTPIPNPQPESVPQIIRLSGEDRIATALRVLEKSSASQVVLVNYESQVDALTGGVLAGYQKTGVLFTKPDSLDTRTLEALRAKHVETVTILGGPKMVSENVVTQLAQIGIKTERIYGVDRYATAALIAQKIADILQVPLTDLPLLVASGQTYVDALVATPLAVQKRGALLLTTDSSLPMATQKILENNQKSFTVLGGLADRVINSEKTLRSRVGDSVFGIDRVHTSVKVANQYFVNSKLAALVNGWSSADAVVAGAYMANQNAPVLLTKKEEVVPEVRQVIASKSLAVVVGGVSQIPEELLVSYRK